MTDYRFDSVEKDPDETLKLVLDWFQECAKFWRPNELYGAGETVRPTVPTGFAYSATAGTTGGREPRWPVALGDTVVDGSVTWEAIAADGNGVNELSDEVVTPPDGISAAVAVSEGTKLAVEYSGGTLDEDYDVVFSVTLDGVTRIARQTVEVRAL